MTELDGRAPRSAHVLYLLRHAKSSWVEPLPDHERPLSKRGIRDAGAAGRLLAERGWRPDLVLCSTAVRTRETWQRLHASGADAGEVRNVEAIYEASAAQLLGLVHETSEQVGALLVIGHDPGLPGLAAALGARPEPRAAWDKMDTAYPTAGLTVLRLPGAWAAVAPGTAELVAFEVPRG